MVYQMSQSNLSSLAYDQLLQGIISFEILPGTTLQERSLAEQLEMSRTPIREALRRLTHEGWVQNSLKRNVMQVKPISAEEIEELFEIRQLFEMRGVERIFDEKINSQVGNVLLSISESLRRCGASPEFDEMEYMTTDMKFHTELMHFKEKSRLGKIWNQLNLESIRLGIMALKSRNSNRSTVAHEHDAIATGMIHKRKKEVREAVRYHNEQTKLHTFKSLEGILRSKV